LLPGFCDFSLIGGLRGLQLRLRLGDRLLLFLVDLALALGLLGGALGRAFRGGLVDRRLTGGGLRVAHRLFLRRLRLPLAFDLLLLVRFVLTDAIRPALGSMKTRKRGAIVCVSSIMGVAYGWDQHVHYSAAKSGVVGLVRGLAVEKL